MRTPVDALFIEQARHFRLRLFCEDCVYFDAENRRCSEGYPNHAHLRVELESATEVVFCKSFEVG